MKKLKSLWIELSNHNRYKCVAILFCCLVLVWCHGCQIQGNSILHPGKKVTIEQLQAEVDEAIAQAQAEANSMQRKQAFRDFLITQGLQTVSAGTFNWLNFLTGASTILGVGAFADNVRYRIKFPEKKSA